ncbi:RidA family protein [Reinekea blandensis]|nr:RidA family protein [Reinekea blandensis]
MSRQFYSLDSTFEKLLNYSRVVVDDEWVFVSGCSGFDYSDMSIADTMTEQVEQTFKNIQWCLSQAGAVFEDVVRIRVIVADRDHYNEAATVIGRYCAQAKPANTTWFAELPDPRIKIEIEVTAKKRR